MNTNKTNWLISACYVGIVVFGIASLWLPDPHSANAQLSAVACFVFAWMLE